MLRLQVDLLAEIAVPPRFRPGAEALLPPALRAEVDAYLGSRQPAGFLAALRQRLLLPAHEVHLCGTKFNVPLLNALVFYVGVQARRPSPAPALPVTSPACGTLRAGVKLLRQASRPIFSFTRSQGLLNIQYPQKSWVQQGRR